MFLFSVNQLTLVSLAQFKTPTRGIYYVQIVMTENEAIVVLMLICVIVVRMCIHFV